MDIAAYLKKHNLTQEQFAQSFKPKVSQGLVWQWINGRTQITAERAVEIETITGGQIKRQELRPDLYRKERAA